MAGEPQSERDQVSRVAQVKKDPIASSGWPGWAWLTPSGHDRLAFYYGHEGHVRGVDVPADALAARPGARRHRCPNRR
jgi:hypothetical protein